MLTWSGRFKQTFLGRGVCGAHKLIPMSPENSRAPALPTLGSSTHGYQASPLMPSPCILQRLIYRTINNLVR